MNGRRTSLAFCAECDVAAGRRVDGPVPDSRPRLRILERLPRYRQCGGDGHLHQFAEAAGGRRLARLDEFPRRAARRDRRRLRARRDHPARRAVAAERRPGDRPAGRAVRVGPGVEPPHLGVGHSQFEFACADRRARRHRGRELARSRARPRQRNRLASDLERPPVAPRLAAARLRLFLAAVPGCCSRRSNGCCTTRPFSTRPKGRSRRSAGCAAC